MSNMKMYLFRLKKCSGILRNCRLNFISFSFHTAQTLLCDATDLHDKLRNVDDSALFLAMLFLNYYYNYYYDNFFLLIAVLCL